jgi:hypothetical protein
LQLLQRSQRVQLLQRSQRVQPLQLSQLLHCVYGSGSGRGSSGRGSGSGSGTPPTSRPLLDRRRRKIEIIAASFECALNAMLVA